MAEDISNIPDNKFFAVKGKDIKDMLGILQIIEARDRNLLFSLYRQDTKDLFARIRAAEEIAHLEKRELNVA